MSNATVIQLYDRVFIGSDSAVSTKFEDKIYRIGDEGRKLFVVDDKVIFCSGNMDLSYLVMGYYQLDSDKSINALAMIAKELFNIYANSEFALDIMVCKIQNGKSIVYFISPYNDFKVIKQELNYPDQYAIWTGGIKTKESFDIANQMLLRGSSINSIYRQVFSQISFEGVGGTLTAYSLSSNEISKILEEQIIENKYDRLNLNELSQSSLIVGENVYGTLGAFAKVTASSIIVGDDNQALPDSVIGSASNWNSTYDNAVEYSDEMLRAAKTYSDTTLVTANGYSNQINSAIRNDLRLTAALPTSISLNASGITATTTTDPLKFARLDHRGLYIQNGALQITSTDGTTVIDGSGVNASKIYTGSLSGINMSIGTGNSIFKADANGIYLGNANFGAAPFKVDMSGNVTANNITLSGTINSSEMNNSVIKGGSLNIGNGIFMVDSNGNVTIKSGSISWGSVGKPSYSPYEVGALPIGAPQLTNITSTGIYTGAITANQITAGKITASQIDTTNLSVAKIYQNGSPNNYAVLGGQFGDLELYYQGNNYFTVYNAIDSVTFKHRGRDHLRFSSVSGSSHPLGNWNFSGATVSGLDTVAVFG